MALMKAVTIREEVLNAQIQKVLSEKVPYFDKVFFVVFFCLMRGGKIQIPLLAGHSNGVSLQELSH